VVLAPVHLLCCCRKKHCGAGRCLSATVYLRSAGGRAAARDVGGVWDGIDKRSWTIGNVWFARRSVVMGVVTFAAAAAVPCLHWRAAPSPPLKRKPSAAFRLSPLATSWSPSLWHSRRMLLLPFLFSLIFSWFPLFVGVCGNVSCCICRAFLRAADMLRILASVVRTNKMDMDFSYMCWADI